MSATGCTKVIGLGNVLMGDDAFGPHVLQELLAGWEFPEGVEVEDLGTPGLNLHPFLEGVETLVVVDTVRADGAPGDRRSYRRDQILKHPPTPRVSPHDPGLKTALLSLEFAGRGPTEVILLGVIPESVKNEVGLSSPVRGAIEPIVGEVLAELARLGHEVKPIPEATPPELWWEKA